MYCTEIRAKTQKLIFAIRINVMFAFRKLRSSRTTFLFKNISFQYLLAVTSITFQTPVAYIAAKSFSIPTGLCKPGMTAPVSTLEFHL